MLFVRLSVRPSVVCLPPVQIYAHVDDRSVTGALLSVTRSVSVAQRDTDTCLPCGSTLGHYMTQASALTRVTSCGEVK